MTTPKVSIILTFHNRPEMVKRALKKITLQTFQDFELILVDDYSSLPLRLEDINFGEIQVNCIRNKTNLGANQSRLNGLKLARGKYICFHDDDDYWMKTKLEKQFNFLESRPNFHLVTAYAQANKKIVKFPLNPSLFSLSIYNCIGSFSIPMIRNSNILYSSLDNNLTNAQDWNVWRNIVKYHKVGTLKDVLVFFDDGLHDRISSIKNINQYYSSYLKVALIDTPNNLIKYYHKSLANYHRSESIIKKCIWGFIMFILRAYIKMRLMNQEF